MTEVTVRLARPEELTQVQGLNHELFLSDARHFDDLNTDWPYQDGADYFRQRIAGDGGVCLVAETGGKLVGYVVGGWSHLNFSAYQGKRAELENICVTAEHRSSGVGAKLVAALYDWCREQGADYVMVDVYSPNMRAYHFYEKQGFEPYSSVLWHKL